MIYNFLVYLELIIRAAFMVAVEAAVLWFILAEVYGFEFRFIYAVGIMTAFNYVMAPFHAYMSMREIAEYEEDEENV
jgi:hypothetical protein